MTDAPQPQPAPDRTMQYALLGALGVIGLLLGVLIWVIASGGGDDGDDGQVASSSDEPGAERDGSDEDEDEGDDDASPSASRDNDGDSESSDASSEESDGDGDGEVARVTTRPGHRVVRRQPR